MCGIVGYAGEQRAVSILTQGLASLEYRGYDSAGICVMEENIPKITKAKGRLSNLIQKLEQEPKSLATVGIGHTRWATHGAPSDHNAHPHSGKDGLFTVVHNGIIENDIALKEMLLSEGYRFQSETDTEVIAQLLCRNHQGDAVKTIRKTVSMLKGSYALGILYKNQPDRIYAIRKESPLILGKCIHGSLLASDIPAILPHTNQVFFLENEELAILKKDKISIQNLSGEIIHKEPFTVDWTVESAQKTGYEHFMQKEMAEQAEAVEKTLNCYLKKDQIEVSDFPLSREFLGKFQRIRAVIINL